MKKFFTMFAFAAAIVLGAFTLASCGDDDVKTPEAEKFSFTFEGEINSTNPQTLSDPDWEEARAEFSRRFKNSSQDYNVVGTNLQADMAWANYLNSPVYAQLTTELNEYAKKVNDLTITLTIKLMKNGKEVHQQKIYKAWY